MKLKLQSKSERKIVANAISQATNQTAVYAKTPTYAYNIGAWHIDRHGAITTALTDELETVLDVLKEHITNDISFVLESFPKSASNRIRNILEVKGNLIEKAIGSKITLQIEDNYCEINCNFDENNFDLISSVAIFMLKLSQLALKLKYVSLTEKAVDNEKYAFRCFLLRLGFIGSEYKQSRKLLMRNLIGNTAFKIKEEIVK